MALLEPQAPDSLLAWGEFNNAFEQKEYMEPYVAEEVARAMLSRDPPLKSTFERRLKDDPAFAKDPQARLDFFYRRHASGTNATGSTRFYVLSGIRTDPRPLVAGYVNMGRVQEGDDPMIDTDAVDSGDREQLRRWLLGTAEGDRRAFEDLYQRTSAKLFGVCLRILHERNEAEEVLQDVYLTIWRKASQYDADRASPITWLAMIARNKAIDRLRAGCASNGPPYPSTWLLNWPATTSQHRNWWKPPPKAGACTTVWRNSPATRGASSALRSSRAPPTRRSRTAAPRRSARSRAGSVAACSN